jgi:hypothetical protein
MLSFSMVGMTTSLWYDQVLKYLGHGVTRAPLRAAPPWHALIVSQAVV